MRCLLAILPRSHLVNTFLNGYQESKPIYCFLLHEQKQTFFTRILHLCLPCFILLCWFFLWISLQLNSHDHHCTHNGFLCLTWNKKYATNLRYERVYQNHRSVFNSPTRKTLAETFGFQQVDNLAYLKVRCFQIIFIFCVIFINIDHLN